VLCFNIKLNCWKQAKFNKTDERLKEEKRSPKNNLWLNKWRLRFAFSQTQEKRFPKAAPTASAQRTTRVI
jgi:hypothetical protein